MQAMHFERLILIVQASLRLMLLTNFCLKPLWTLNSVSVPKILPPVYCESVLDSASVYKPWSLHFPGWALNSVSDPLMICFRWLRNLAGA